MEMRSAGMAFITWKHVCASFVRFGHIDLAKDDYADG